MIKHGNRIIILTGQKNNNYFIMILTIQSCRMAIVNQSIIYSGKLAYKSGGGPTIRSVDYINNETNLAEEVRMSDILHPLITPLQPRTLCTLIIFTLIGS